MVPSISVLRCLMALADFVSYHRAQFKTEFTQFGTYNLTHLGGAFGRVGLRLRFNGHQTIFLGKVGSAAEGASIVNGVLEEELHAQVVDGLVGTVNHTLQHEVGFLELVVEEEIVV